MNYQELISEFWTNAIESHWFIRGAQCRAEGRWVDFTQHDRFYDGWKWAGKAMEIAGWYGKDPWPKTAEESRSPELWNIIDKMAYGRVYKCQKCNSMNSLNDLTKCTGCGLTVCFGCLTLERVNQANHCHECRVIHQSY